MDFFSELIENQNEGSFFVSVNAKQNCEEEAGVGGLPSPIIGKRHCQRDKVERKIALKIFFTSHTDGSKTTKMKSHYLNTISLYFYYQGASVNVNHICQIIETFCWCKMWRFSWFSTLVFQFLPSRFSSFIFLPLTLSLCFFLHFHFCLLDCCTWEFYDENHTPWQLLAS